MVEGRQPDGRSAGGVVASDPARVNANVIGPGFLRTLGIPLVIGRDFSDQDIEGRPLVVIVNETMVRMHFGGGNAIDKRISVAGHIRKNALQHLHQEITITRKMVRSPSKIRSPGS